jgi:Fe-S cluster biogenesis protein NfuA/Fe-S cluster assembly iron-binding protein IscA
MVVLTERAAEAVRQFQEDQDRIGAGLRVTVTKANGGYDYSLDLEDEPSAQDDVFESEGVRVFLDRDQKAVEYDLTVDFEGQGFRIYPQPTPELRGKVEKALDYIRPALVADGGNIELVDIVDGVVRVQLKGACGSCPSATVTLKQGVERTLKERVPGIVGVEAV